MSLCLTRKDIPYTLGFPEWQNVPVSLTHFFFFFVNIFPFLLSHGCSSWELLFSYFTSNLPYLFNNLLLLARFEIDSNANWNNFFINFFPHKSEAL